MTSRRELADRLEVFSRNLVGLRATEIADLTEAARLLRGPVAGEVEELRRAGIWAQPPKDKMLGLMGTLDAFEAGKLAATEAIIRARLDAEGKGGEA